MKIVFDTYAWVEYFSGSLKGKNVESYIKEHDIITPIVAIIELNCKSDKEGWDFEEILDFIKSKSTISFINWDVVRICSKNYWKQKKIHKNFGIMDAIILSTAQVNNAKLLTGDEHFIELDETIFLN